MDVDDEEEDDFEEEEQNFGRFGIPKKRAAPSRPITRGMMFGFGGNGFDFNQSAA